MPPKKKTEEEEKEDRYDEKEYKVIKTTLNSILHDQKILEQNFTKDFDKKKFISFLLDYVKTFSQSVHKGSILYNLFLLENINDDEKLKHINKFIPSSQFHSVGITKLQTNKFITDLWDKYFKEHPFKKEVQSVTPLTFGYYAKTYDANFRNSLWMNYQARQYSYIKTWLEVNKIDLIPYFIQAKINNWSYSSKNKIEEKKEKNISKKVSDFIENERKELGVDDRPTSDAWLKIHEMRIVLVKYYYKILSYLEKNKISKKFTLAPVTKITNLYMFLDNAILYHVITNFLSCMNILKKSTKIKNIVTGNMGTHKEQLWDSIFNLKKIRDLSPNSLFSFMISTDGFATSILYDKLGSKMPQAEPSVEELEKMEIKKLKTKNARVIAIDPGRTNLLYGVEKDQEGNIKKYELKKSVYYNSTGMNKELAFKKRKLEIDKAEELIYRQFSLKTTNTDTYINFIKSYLSVYDVLWKTRTSKKWLSQKFRTYTLKQKFMDNLVNCMLGESSNKKKEKARLVVAYGDAKFAPSGRGERPGPTSWLSGQIAKKVKTVFIDEYYTTKKCNDCGNTLCPVHDKISNEERMRRRNKVKKKMTHNLEPDDKKEAKKIIDTEIRGLRWCSTCRTYKNRDMNAALNILEVFNHKRNHLTDLNSRPVFLTKESGNKDVKSHLYSLEEIKKKRKLAKENGTKTTSISLIRNKAYSKKKFNRVVIQQQTSSFKLCTTDNSFSCGSKDVKPELGVTKKNQTIGLISSKDHTLNEHTEEKKILTIQESPPNSLPIKNTKKRGQEKPKHELLIIKEKLDKGISIEIIRQEHVYLYSRYHRAFEKYRLIFPIKSSAGDVSSSSH